MYKNFSLLFIIVASFLIISCGENKASSPEPEKLVTDSVNAKTMVTDSPASTSTGNDTDEHGCKHSAGYRWSVIKNNCIRIFENSTKLSLLNATADTNTAAYIIFSDDHNKAELFLPSEKSSIILERKAEGQPWSKDDWQLIPWKGYVLKKNNMAVYGGM